MELTQIGFAVRTARQAARMSAKELASATALTPTALSKIENGHQNLDFITAINIARALKIDVGHLAALAEKVEECSNESSDVRQEFALRLKALEKKAIRTALSLAHGVQEIDREDQIEKINVGKKSYINN